MVSVELDQRLSIFLGAIEEAFADCGEIGIYRLANVPTFIEGFHLRNCRSEVCRRNRPGWGIGWRNARAVGRILGNADSRRKRRNGTTWRNRTWRSRAGRHYGFNIELVHDRRR
jgi:hypothetical protein